MISSEFSAIISPLRKGAHGEQLKLNTIIAICLCLLLSTVGVAQGVGERPTLIPSQTKVAILWVTNSTGDKWPELKSRQNDRAIAYLKDEFGRRGFTVMPTKIVSETDGLKESRAMTHIIAESLQSQGQKVGANLVVCVEITASRQGKSGGLFPVEQGFATTKCWVVDVATGEKLLNGTVKEGRANGKGFLVGIDKGSDLRVAAVARSLEAQLKGFLKPYPIQKT